MRRYGVIAIRAEQAPPLRQRCSPDYFEVEVAFEVLLESLDDDDLLFDSDLELLSDLELFEPESVPEPESDFFSDLESDLDSVFSDFDPLSEDSESEPLPEAPFDARLSVT